MNVTCSTRRRSFFCMFVLALITAAARAELPRLPERAIADDTFLVVTVDVTVQANDEETGKRVADAVTQLGDMLKTQAAQIKPVALQLPQLAPMSDAMLAIAEAFKPTQAGPTVTFTADAKAVGGVATAWLTTSKMQPGAASKGGL